MRLEQTILTQIPRLLLTLLLHPLAVSSTLVPKCKAIPGDNDGAWPTPQQWDTLNLTVSGRLFAPASPGAACHAEQQSYDPDLCASVQRNWTTWEFHAADPVSTHFGQFSNYTCLPVPEYPCSTDGYPRFVIRAEGVEDVQAAVMFAKKHNVRLVVRGTGHDFLGRSSAPNSLSVWTQAMKDVKFHDSGSFKPKGCSTTIGGTAVTVGAGMQMEELYRALDGRGQVAVGGMARSVGVGGYLTGGGHSILSVKYGLGADNVLEVEMVIPDGSVVVANECQNEDLFWAVRGGGGSTFGILTSVTMSTHEIPNMPTVGLTMLLPPEHPDLLPLRTYMYSQIPYLVNSDVNGYIFSFQSPPSSSDNPVAKGILALLVQPGLSLSSLQSVLEPLTAHIAEHFPDAQVSSDPSTYDRFVDWFDRFYDNSPAGGNAWLGSRLLDGKSIVQDADRLAEMVAATTERSEEFMLLVVGGRGVSEAKPRGGGNAVLDAWRRTVVHVVFSVSFPPFDTAAKLLAQEEIESIVAPMRKLAPDTGAYLNEANPYEPDFGHAFWGNKYERLLEIKRRVDPDDVLWCVPCVGNERWQETDDGRVCRV